MASIELKPLDIRLFCVELTNNSRQAAAQIFAYLHRQRLTVRSPIDCCIAQAVSENNLLLLVDDPYHLTSVNLLKIYLVSNFTNY